MISTMHLCRCCIVLLIMVSSIIGQQDMILQLPDYSALIERLQNNEIDYNEMIYLLQGQMDRAGDQLVPDSACTATGCMVDLTKDFTLDTSTSSGMSVTLTKDGFVPVTVSISLTQLSTIFPLEHQYYQPKVNVYMGMATWNNDAAAYDDCFNSPTWSGYQDSSGAALNSSYQKVYDSKWYAVIPWDVKAADWCRNSDISFNDVSICARKVIALSDEGILFSKISQDAIQTATITLAIKDTQAILNSKEIPPVGTELCITEGICATVQAPILTPPPIYNKFIGSKYTTQSVDHIVLEEHRLYDSIMPLGSASGTGPGGYQVSKYSGGQYSDDFAGIDVLNNGPKVSVCSGDWNCETLIQLGDKHTYANPNVQLSSKIPPSKQVKNKARTVKSYVNQINGINVYEETISGQDVSLAQYRLLNHLKNTDTWVDKTASLQIEKTYYPSGLIYSGTTRGGDKWCAIQNEGPPSNQLDIVLSNGRILDTQIGKYHPVTKDSLVLSGGYPNGNELTTLSGGSAIIKGTIKLSGYSMQYNTNPGDISNWDVPECNIVISAAGSYLKLYVEYQGTGYTETIESSHSLYTYNVYLESGAKTFTIGILSATYGDSVSVTLRGTTKECAAYTYNDPGSTTPTPPDQGGVTDNADNTYYDLLSMLFAFTWSAVLFCFMIILDILFGIGLVIAFYKIVAVLVRRGYNKVHAMIAVSLAMIALVGATNPYPGTSLCADPITTYSSCRCSWTTVRSAIERHTDMKCITIKVDQLDRNDVTRVFRTGTQSIAYSIGNWTCIDAKYDDGCCNPAYRHRTITDAYIDLPLVARNLYVDNIYTFDYDYYKNGYTEQGQSLLDTAYYQGFNRILAALSPSTEVPASTYTASGTTYNDAYFADTSIGSVAFFKVDSSTRAFCYTPTTTTATSISQPLVVTQGKTTIHRFLLGYKGNVDPYSAIPSIISSYPYLENHDYIGLNTNASTPNSIGLFQIDMVCGINCEEDTPGYIRKARTNVVPNTKMGVFRASNRLDGYITPTGQGPSILGGPMIVRCNWGDSSMARCDRSKNIFYSQGINVRTAETNISMFDPTGNIVTTPMDTFVSIYPNDHFCTGKIILVTAGIYVCGSDCCIVTSDNWDTFDVIEAGNIYISKNSTIRTMSSSSMSGQASYSGTDGRCRAIDSTTAIKCWQDQWGASFYTCMLFSPVCVVLILISFVIRKTMNLSLISQSWKMPARIVNSVDYYTRKALGGDTSDFRPSKYHKSLMTKDRNILNKKRHAYME